jgi:hypothetical protein
MILSYVSAGLAGLILFGRWKDFAVVGLANLGTIVTLYFVLRRKMRTTINPAQQPPRPAWLPRKRGPFWRTPKGFIALFTGFFVLGTVGLQVMLSWPCYGFP